ncbi:MAG: peptidylprolyl isomerase [Thermodesulfobacteriota bacterium]
MKILCSLAMAGVLLGCSDFDRFYKEKKTGTFALNKTGTVVAKVGSEEITSKELSNTLESLPVKQRFLYQSSPERMNDFLESYINQTLLYKEAQRKGLETRQDIRENLAKYKRQLLIQSIGQEVTNKKFGEDEIKKYYQENSENFEQVKLSQIFIKAGPNGKVSMDEARTTAELITKRARSGERFDDLVKQFSDDLKSKKKGGDLGYVSRGRLPIEVENEIFILKEGEISDPIETPNGFHIIKVAEGVKIPPLEQVKSRVQLDLRKKIFNDYIKNLRERAGVEIFEDKLKETSANE